MPSIEEIRESYRETLAAAKTALEDATSREARRLTVRAAALALDAVKESQRLLAASTLQAKLQAKIEDYTARLKGTGTET